jgi:hypothetical protein
MLHTRANLQNAADAAALAGAQILLRERCLGTEESASRALADAEAERLKQANCPGTIKEILFGNADALGAFVPADVSTPASAVKVIVRRNAAAAAGTVKLAFAPLLGTRECDVAASATAEFALDINGINDGMAPFGVPISRIDTDLDGTTDVEQGDQFNFYPCDGLDYDPETGDTTTIPGAFGLMNLDGGDLGTTEIIDWLINGYDAGVELDENGEKWVDGTSGFRAAMQRTLQQLVDEGRELVVLVYDRAIQQGANADFRCVGFIAGKLTSVDLTGNDPHITFEVTEIAIGHGISTGNSTPSANIRKVQLVW